MSMICRPTTNEQSLHFHSKDYFLCSLCRHISSIDQKFHTKDSFCMDELTITRQKYKILNKFFVLL